jgi:GNAT superfamily N-acetyltransferase
MTRAEAPVRRGRLAKYARDARTFPADAMSAWGRERVAGVWSEVAHRSVYRLARWSRSFVIEQDVAQRRERPVPPGIIVEPFDGERWERLAPIATGRELALMAATAARGRTCFVAWRGEHPVGYTWCSDRMEPDIEVYPLPLPADAAYLWDLYVTPSERSGGIGTALASARLDWAYARGFRRAWRVIRRGNAPSLRTVDKTSGGSARVLGELRYLKLLNRAFASYRPYATARSGRLT